MKVKFEHIPSLIKRYGIFKGLDLYYRLRQGKKITIPGIKHPIHLRKNTSDIDVFFQIFINKEYGKINDNEVKFIVDGGSNVGLFAIQMKNIFPDAEIVCIEPDPQNFAVLKTNIERYKGISAVNAGLWNRNTKLNVHQTHHGEWGIIVKEDSANGAIDAMSVEHLLRTCNIPYVDIFKLDIESSEKEIFSHDCSAWLPKVKILIVEVHDFMRDGCGKAFLETVLRTYPDFTYYVSGENTIIINKDFERSKVAGNN